MPAEASAAEYNFEMPRNAEVIRQWTILREIERARLTGVTIETLAELSNVTTRTIRRDINAIVGGMGEGPLRDWMTLYNQERLEQEEKA